MKLLPVIVSVIAVLTVNGQDVLDEYGGLDSALGETGSNNSAETDPEATLPILEPISENNEHHFYSNQTGHIIPRKAGSRCKAKDICIIMGGSCVTNATLCGGRLVPGCKGKNCQCCISGTLETKINSLGQMLKTMQANLTNANAILNMKLQTLKDNLTDHNSNLNVDFHIFRDNLTDANLKLSKDLQSMSDNFNDSISNMGSKMDSLMRKCPVGFFHTSGSSQCYKFYNDTTRSWAEGKGKCQTEGLALAEPTNPLSLRKYLVETYGTQRWAYVYLGARGTGSYLRWERSSRQISNSDSLWYKGHPGSSLSTSHCLLVLAEKNSYLANYPNQPYYSQTCSYKYYTLCEYI